MKLSTLMVGYMRWAHSKNAVFLLLVIVPAVIGIGFPFSSAATKSSDQTVIEVLALPTINCFDAKNLFVLTTTDSKCSSDLTFLGDAPLTESAMPVY